MSNLEVIPRELPTLLCTSIVQPMQMCSGGQDINHAIPWMDFKHTEARQDGRHFADDIFKCIFLNENIWILIKISLPKSPINNILALVQIITWRRSGNKLLSEPMMVRLPMHICITHCFETPKFLFWKVHLKLLSVQIGSHFDQQVWNVFL